MTQGSGNAVTSGMLDGTTLVLNKDLTFVTDQSSTNTFWELREDINGKPYLYANYDIATLGGHTMYVDNGTINLPNIYDGLPIDGDTIYWEETENGRILKSKYEGSSGVDASEVLSIVSSAGYATQNWVNNQNFITQSYLATGLLKYVTLDNYQEIIGVKNFINGLQISNIPIKKLEGYNDILYIDSNVVIRGGLTMYYEDGEIDLPTIKDEIGNAGYDGVTGLASFNSSQFSISSDGTVTIIGGSTGLDTAQLKDYLDSNKYTTETWVNGRINDLINGAPSAYDTLKEIADVLEGNINSIGDIVTTLGTKANKDYVDTELAKYLPLKGGTMQGHITLPNKMYIRTESNSHAILGMDGNKYILAAPNKPTTIRSNGTLTHNNSTIWDANTLTSLSQLINDADFTTNAYVNSTFVTLGTKQTITGEKNFTGGLRVNNSPSIYYDATNKYWKLEGDLLVTGGVTMYGDDGSGLPSIFDSLPIASTSSAGIASFDSTYFSVNASGKVTLTSAPSMVSILGSLQDVSPSVSGTTNSDVVLFKSANSSTWATKPLSEIGGGSSGGGSVSGNYLPLSNTSIPIVSNTQVRVVNFKSSNAYEVGIGLIRGNTDKGSLYASNSSIGIYNKVKDTAFYLKDDGGLKYEINGVEHDVLNAGNYSSYALPLSGGTLTGTVTFQTNGNNAFYINEIGKGSAGFSFQKNGSTLGAIRLDENREPSWMYAKTWAWETMLHSGNISSYNAGSATKLQTARTIWGQSFDGTTNITTGDITAYANIGGTTSLNLFKASGDVGWEISGRYTSNQSGLRIYYFDKSNYNEYLHIGVDGNIGVHTNTPGYAIDINGGLGIRDGIAFHTASSLTLLSIKNANNYGFYLKFHSNQAQLYNVEFIGTYGSQNYIDFGCGAGSNTVDAKTSWMRLIKGKLGIGTLDPSSPLHVIGDAAIRDGLYMARASDNSYNFFIGKESGTIFQILNSSGGGEIHLRTNNSSTISSRVVIGGGSTTIYNSLITKSDITLDKASGNNASINLRGTTTDLWQLSSRYGTASGEKNVTKLYYYNGSTWSTTMQITTAGNMTVLGGITMYSDQRKKTILNHVELSLKQIADAPLIQHYYNSDQEKTTHVGSIAQYWARLNDWFCKLDAEGYYTMEIQNCALASAISIARHLEKYESKTDKKIQQLKKRISQLEDELELLKKGV